MAILIAVVAAVAVLALIVMIVVLRGSERGSSQRRKSTTDALGSSVPGETEEERRLRKLREFQRAEKIREAAEEAELERLRAERAELQQEVEEIEDEQQVRLRQLREFQRAEKIREAAEELEKHGPEPEIEKPIGTLVTEEIREMGREEELFRERQQEAYDRAELSRVVGEARDLVVDMNAQYGWQPGEPSIPDRMFNTDVETVIGTAISKGRVDFRLQRMVSTMRSFARAQTGGRNEIAKVMATRVLLGSGRLTEEEIAKMNDMRRLFGDNFAEAAGFVDHLTRQQEIIKSKRLGMAASRARGADRDDFGIERNR